MLYCRRMFDHIYMDHHNGQVMMCPWMDARGIIGNILEEDFMSIWHGKKASKIREDFRNGCFDLCRRVACPIIQNGQLEDLEYSENDPKWRETETPREIALAFDFVCNLACPTCRNDFFHADQEYSKRVDEIIDRILPYVNKADRIMGSGHGDTFASPYLMRLLEKMNPENPKMHIVLETNGVYFDEDHWKRIEHLSKYDLNITVTTNSYYEPVYLEISKGGDLEKLKKNELFIKELREAGKLNHTINSMVVQDKNYREIPDFIHQSLDVYGFDEVNLRPVYNWGNLSEEEYWFKDVLNPLHPYHQAYMDIISLPIVKDNPRVYNFGGETEHEPKPMPGTGGEENKKNKAYFELFKKWLNTDDIGDAVDRYLKEHDCKTYAVYGAADVGKALVKACNSSLCDLIGFIDQFMTCECVNGVQVLRINDSKIKKADAILVTPIHAFEQVSKELKQAGYSGMIVPVDQVLDKCNG